MKLLTHNYKGGQVKPKTVTCNVVTIEIEDYPPHIEISGSISIGDSVIRNSGAVEKRDTTLITMEFSDGVLWSGSMVDLHEAIQEHAIKRAVDKIEEEEEERRCDVTGEVITKGWCFNNGEKYASTQEIADQIAREYGYKDFDDMYVQQGGDENSPSYYTEWED